MGLFIPIPILLITGGIGFGLILLHDYLQIKQKNLSKLPAISGILLVGTASTVLCFLKALPKTELWISVLGLGAAAASGFMVLYTTYLEFPKNDDDYGYRKIYDRGSYGLTRHPGFLWYALYLIFVVMTYRDIGVAVCAAVLLGMEIAVVIIEDMLLFPKIFPDYPEYKKRVPMLFPFAKRRE